MSLCALGSSRRLIRPSTLARSPPPASHLYHGFNLTTDAPHVILSGDPNATTLRVFLPGTGSAPLAYSCLLRSLAVHGVPLIGMSYSWHPSSDATRNAMCSVQHHEDSNGVVRCLEWQHEDALWGGNSEPTIWPAVPVGDSISGRLTRLLVHLGWHTFLNSEGTAPDWSRIWMGGHSQGGGHSAHLAATHRLRGVTLLSAPQDECIGCPSDTLLWLHRPWASIDVRALAHRNESAARIILSNWRQLGVHGWSDTTRDVGLGISPPAEAANGKADTVASPADVMAENRRRRASSVALQASSSHASSHAMAAPGPWLTWLSPPPQLVPYGCHGRPYHCSTAKDATTPIAAAVHGDVAPLYGIWLWPFLYGVQSRGRDAAVLVPASDQTFHGDGGSVAADTHATQREALSAAAGASFVLFAVACWWLCWRWRRRLRLPITILKRVRRSRASLPPEVQLQVA